MADQTFETATKPWSKEKLDQHVKQCIRDHAEAVLVIEQDDDDARCARLRKAGEDLVWRIVQQAIEDAGWQICHEDRT